MCVTLTRLYQKRKEKGFSSFKFTVKEINMTTSHTIHVLDSQFGHKLFKNSYRLLFLNV